MSSGALEERQESLAEVPQARPTKPKRRLPARMVGACGWFYLACVLGLWLLLAAADRWWPATFFLFSPRWVAGLPLIVLLPAAAVFHRRALGPLSLAVLVLVGPVMGFCVPWQNLVSSPPAGTRLRLLSCNMHYYQANTRLLEQLIADSRPDIVLLQEWRGSELSETFESGWHTHDVRGLFLASIYPLRRATPFGNDSTGEQALIMKYELETPAGIINVFSLHLASPRDGLERMVHERGTAPDDLEANCRLRWRQSEYLAGLADQVSGPLLLAGDFNTPPESAIFRSLWDRYTDAFGTAGWGWGYTFRGNHTLVRIDHILTGPGWHCDACWVGPYVRSSHRPVLADLTWTGGGNDKVTR
jgi:endonuclease/exonuclease/phosphatase (EEP) superfamily protein YafD